MTLNFVLFAYSPKFSKFKHLKMLGVIWAIVLLGACEKPMAPAGIRGYNHTTDRSIYTFKVNGRMGHNITPGGGGGSESCCASIPRRWRPGLKARIAWEYQGGDAIPPPPPSQEVEVDIPQYKHPGNLHVHFYADHKVKVVISNCSLGHPFYPMSLADQLPWSPEYSKEEAIESFKKGGPDYEC